MQTRLETLPLPTISEGTDVATNKPAWQSSTTQQGFATNAISDHRSSDVNFARTANTDSPWWIVDLEAEFEITELLVRLKTSGIAVKFLFVSNPFSFNRTNLDILEKKISCLLYIKETSDTEDSFL